MTTEEYFSELAKLPRGDRRRILSLDPGRNRSLLETGTVKVARLFHFSEDLIMIPGCVCHRIILLELFPSGQWSDLFQVSAIIDRSIYHQSHQNRSSSSTQIISSILVSLSLHFGNGISHQQEWHRIYWLHRVSCPSAGSSKLSQCKHIDDTSHPCIKYPTNQI